MAPFQTEIEGWLQAWFADLSMSGLVKTKALFIPAERTCFSRFINSAPQILGPEVLPLTMPEFAKFLGKAAAVHQTWQSSAQLAQRPIEADEIEQLMQKALSGKTVYSQKGPYARKWQWSDQPIEIERVDQSGLQLSRGFTSLNALPV